MFSGVRENVLYRLRLTPVVSSFVMTYTPGPGIARSSQNGTAHLDDGASELFLIASTFDLVSAMATTLTTADGFAAAAVNSQCVMTWEFLGSDLPSSAKSNAGWSVNVEGFKFIANSSLSSPTYGAGATSGVSLVVTEIPVFNPT